MVKHTGKKTSAPWTAEISSEAEIHWEEIEPLVAGIMYFYDCQTSFFTAIKENDKGNGIPNAPQYYQEWDQYLANASESFRAADQNLVDTKANPSVAQRYVNEIRKYRSLIAELNHAIASVKDVQSEDQIQSQEYFLSKILDKDSMTEYDIQEDDKPHIKAAKILQSYEKGPNTELEGAIRVHYLVAYDRFVAALRSIKNDESIRQQAGQKFDYAKSIFLTAWCKTNKKSQRKVIEDNQQ